MMTTQLARGRPVSNAPRSAFEQVRGAMLLAAASSLLAAGCATTEHRFAAKELPSELQAQPWHAPCAMDLSAGVADHRPPKFDSGDEVEILVATGLKQSDIIRLKTTVARDGTVELPELGRIRIAGQTPEVARQAVVQACHHVGASQTPVVQISLQQPRQQSITVTGAVQHPGNYTLPRQSSDLVSALAAAGGVARDAGTKIVIQSRRSDGDVNRVDADRGQVEQAVYAESSGGPGQRREVQLVLGQPPAREELKDGDVITVERRDPPSVVVTGMVHKPGRYDFPVENEFRVLDAVANAHGVEYKVIDTVFVCREIPGKAERAVITVSLREATRNKNENILLKPGDIVSVEANTRVLMDDVINFVGSAVMGVAPIMVR